MSLDAAEKRSLALVLVAACLAVAAVVVVVQRVHGDDPRARVGEVIDGYYVDDEAVDVDQARVALPYGYVDVEVSAPREKMRFYDAADATFGPPDGGSFVEVLARVEEDGVIATRATSDKPSPAPQLVLRDGSRSYPIDRLGEDLVRGSSVRSVYVAVAGHPDDLVLDVVYDGVTQTVDPADGSVEKGRAAPLYDLPVSDGISPPPRTHACGRPSWTPGFHAAYRAKSLQPSCRVTATRTPYVGGVGWAEEGHTWLVVNATGDGPGDVRRRGYPDAYYNTDFGAFQWVARLDGEDAAAESGIAGQAVFDVTTETSGTGGGELELAQHHRTWTDEPGAPRAADLTISWTVDLDDLPEVASEPGAGE